MTNSEIPPYRQSLQVLLHQRGYHSYDELAQAAEISRWHLLRLERGLFPQIPVGILMKLAITLGEPLDVLIKQLSLLPPPSNTGSR